MMGIERHPVVDLDGARVPGYSLVTVALPDDLIGKIVDYARRHREGVSSVIEQAMTRALREQKL